MTTQGSRTDEKIVAFVLYPGLTPLDLVGPLQVFASLQKFAPMYRAVVVAERIAPLPTDIEVQMVADKTFAEVPHPDILVVPGGTGPTLRAMSDQTLRDYVRTAAGSAEIVASVCTGSLILAAVGLLDSHPRTTHWVARDLLKSYGTPYQQTRWVEHGKIITAAGVSAGIDMALYLVAKLTDLETMRNVQLDLEYDPHPPFGRIDLERMGFMPRMIRGLVSITAPLLTRKPKRLSKQAGWTYS
ncbi:MAG TPA: DJ-1/PfpI family protein [Thermomicrobiales bacterium]|nr:DJ-1/PfpI family protein [Thermomicrobiales bacterium]